MRAGHRVLAYEAAKKRALQLRAVEVEIRDESKPRARSLVAIVSKGVILELPR